ncbi:hypothetical protein Pnap_4347 (plasmid) [Polaromonas naphthalenivorans CJ2]|uniref:Uncharacterized protein n=1 Tax=Polaromonas naphthalenivorans (strain CJ2) TaxID=365044 RepID=A1VVF1_POLNA|nr:hypothetical protein Pnap_4347 [Polaromonas naphthalenivorans CJ2]
MWALVGDLAADGILSAKIAISPPKNTQKIAAFTFLKRAKIQYSSTHSPSRASLFQLLLHAERKKPEFKVPGPARSRLFLNPYRAPSPSFFDRA